jgi:uncharacterized membrane protein
MHERAYRQRLQADLARWQGEGLLPPASADAIRATLRPVPEGVTIATVVGIVGGLLIAAAFLAFVAANWTVIARPMRFAILIAGIVGAYGAGALFDRAGRAHLADLCAGVGSIVFGAAIALTGQMYHLGDDFAGGLLLWAAGALAAAVLTGSRSALAVALAAACFWSSMRIFATSDIHVQFVAFWLIAAALALMWNAPVARHLVALSALAWAVMAALGADQSRLVHAPFLFVGIVSFMIGGGLLLATRTGDSVRHAGLTLSNHGAFGLAFGVAFIVLGMFRPIDAALPGWLIGLGAVAAFMAFAAAAAARKPGPALAGVAIVLALVVASGAIRTTAASEPWLAYALALGAMLSLVVSGMLDDVRPRVIAGWIGLALTIAAITWAVRGSLLHRAAFLALSGLVAVALASLLGRLLGKERRR